jgi:hypothetical protein
MATITVTPTSDITTTDWALNGGTTFHGNLAANGTNSVEMTAGTSSNALVLGTGFSTAGMSAVTAVTYTVEWDNAVKSTTTDFTLTLVESGGSTQLATMTNVTTSSTSEITSGPTSMTIQTAGNTLANWANFDIQLQCGVSTGNNRNGVFFGLSLVVTYTAAFTPGPPNPVNLYGGRIAGSEMLYAGPRKTITAYGFR